MQVISIVLLVVLACASCAAGGIWVKGNTHTHTTNSDGDTAPEAVAEWYKSHGYNFLVLSDHNRLTDPAKYDADTTDSFILIPGDEVSGDFQKHPVHVNGLGVSSPLKYVSGENLVDTIQKNIDLVLADKGIAHVNHPNFGWGFDHRELLAVKRYNLLEIFNGHPQVHNSGDIAHISVEQIWDVLLSEGRDIYGMAVDDAHHFQGEFAAARANPGRGWLMVKVDKLTPADVLNNIRTGNFYASTGVQLADYSVDGSNVAIAVKAAEGMTYTIRFIGKHGQILQETDGASASYKLSKVAHGSYVRGKVIASNGTVAWTQPVRRR
jgi:hypothetical protein